MHVNIIRLVLQNIFPLAFAPDSVPHLSRHLSCKKIKSRHKNPRLVYHIKNSASNTRQKRREKKREAQPPVFSLFSPSFFLGYKEKPTLAFPFRASHLPPKPYNLPNRINIYQAAFLE
jgi:hypothetical protein